MNYFCLLIPVTAACVGFCAGRSKATAPSPPDARVEARTSDAEGIPVTSAASGVNRWNSPTAKGMPVAGPRTHRPEAEGDALGEMLPILTDKQLAGVLKTAIQADPSCWNTAFEFLLASNDPGYIEFAQEALAESKDAETADRIAQAVAAEGNPLRRAALAIILGKQNQGVVAPGEIERILRAPSGTPADEVLAHLSLSGFDDEPRSRMLKVLGEVAVNAADDGRRYRALSVLGADESPETTRLLLARMNEDSDADTRSLALRKLPWVTSDEILRKEMVQALLRVTGGTQWDFRHLKLAAQRLQELTGAPHEGLLSAEQRRTIDSLAQRSSSELD